MKITEVFVAAKALIDTPEKHTKGVAARNAKGISVSAHHREAVCFCSIGAINLASHKVNSNWYSCSWQDAQDIFRKANEIDSIAEFNDSATHANVMQAFDKAITYAQQKGI